MSLYIPSNIDQTLGFNIELHARRARCAISKSTTGALFILAMSDGHFPVGTPPEKMIILTSKEHSVHPQGAHVFRKATLTHVVSGDSLSVFLQMRMGEHEHPDSTDEEEDRDLLVTYPDETGEE
jgi:hypothetical protein